jgi:hypothetical protein
VDRRPSLGHGRTTPTALIHPANLLQEVALHRRRWRATLRALFPRKINNLSRPRSWPKLGRRSTVQQRRGADRDCHPARQPGSGIAAQCQGYGMLSARTATTTRSGLITTCSTTRPAGRRDSSELNTEKKALSEKTFRFIWLSSLLGARAAPGMRMGLRLPLFTLTPTAETGDAVWGALVGPLADLFDVGFTAGQARGRPSSDGSPKQRFVRRYRGRRGLFQGQGIPVRRGDHRARRGHQGDADQDREKPIQDTSS